ncbi:MAG: stage V sporulation protein AD [Negativicutes bacterium]|nr:stage V sporulation protein AD [Negativicutes bacterium]
MKKKTGKQSICFASPPYILETATVAGPMEGEGKLGDTYDKILEDNIHGHESWEQCESFMLRTAIETAAKKSKITIPDIDYILAGDLLNQLMSTHFAIRGLERPFLGLYGACSTFAESLLLGAVLLDGGFGETIAIAVSSLHDTAERQYRFPTELGVQRPPISQWTVTGAGSAILSANGQGPRITAATIGKVVDIGIKDPNAMGPAMAPAAADTLYCHFADTGKQPAYYDMIFTGDLGAIGKQLTIELLQEKGYDISGNYEDCGLMIYFDQQDVHSGASGCASSALAFCGHIYKEMRRGRWKRILLACTGSLHSPVSYQQKESIPCIAHAVAIES